MTATIVLAPDVQLGANLIDCKAAGALLGVPPSWLEQAAREERVPHIRLGRYVRFDPDELEAWARDQCHVGPRHRAAA